MTPFSDLLDPLWKTLKKSEGDRKPGLMWRMSVTPPFPAAWPMKKDGALVSYAYGSAMDLTLRDAERISPPFAKVIEPAKGKPTVTPLSKELTVVDTQGFHPISKEAAALQEQAFAVGPALRGGKLDQVRAAWCAWRNNNGAIVAQVREQHAAFLEALACDKK